MRFKVQEGVLTCGPVSVCFNAFCKFHKLEKPDESFTQEQYLEWFMEFVQKNNISASYAVQEAMHSSKSTRKERKRAEAFFYREGSQRFKANQDKIRKCNYCDSKFISVGGSRKCDDCRQKTAEFYVHNQ